MPYNTTPIPTYNETYIGEGTFLIRKRGSNAPFRPIGNSSKVEFSIKENTVRDKNYQGGGGDNDTYSRIDEVTFSIETSNYSAPNLGLAVRSDVAAFAAGTVSGEALTLYKGGLIPTENVGIDSVMITDQAAAPITEGFEARSSGIWVPADSAIADGTQVSVAYSYPAQDGIEAMTAGDEEWEVMFEGMNAAKGGAPVVIRGHRTKFTPTSGLPLISDEYAKLTLTGTLLADSTQPSGKSRFFMVRRAQI